LVDARTGLASLVVAVHLVAAGANAAQASPAGWRQLAQSADDRAGAADKSGKADAVGDNDKDKPDDKDKADEADENKEAPGTRNLDLTASQCEAVALGKPLKDLPPDARVEAVTFTEPPPITLRLPTQSREALAECSLRASGLTVRVDRSRNVITLLPSGTRSPELPNPTIKVTLKLGEEPAKPDQ
jgi:hypothetical protein